MFVVLWTGCYNEDISQIPFNYHQIGLINGLKPMRYLRHKLRHKPEIMNLPIVLCDESYYAVPSRTGYDLVVEFKDLQIKFQGENDMLYETLDLLTLRLQIEDLFRRMYSPVQRLCVGNQTRDTMERVEIYNRQYHRLLTNHQKVLVVGMEFLSYAENFDMATLGNFFANSFVVAYFDMSAQVNAFDFFNYIQLKLRVGVPIRSIIFGPPLKDLNYVRQWLGGGEFLHLPFVLCDSWHSEEYLCEYDLNVDVSRFIFGNTILEIYRIYKFIEAFMAQWKNGVKTKCHKVQITEMPNDHDEPESKKYKLL